MIPLWLQSVLVCFFILGGFYIFYPFEIRIRTREVPKKDPNEFPYQIKLNVILDDEDDD